MKFLVLFLATAAFASATFVGGKYIDIKEDGTIFVKSEDGKQIYITKHYGPYGQKNIEIEVTGPNDFAKMYQFDYNNQVNYGSWGNHIFNTWNKNYQGQYDILDAIFREYLGHVDEYTYQQLLNKVHEAVLNGHFDGHVLYLLQALVEDSKWDELTSGRYSYGQFGDVWNKMTEQNKYGLGFLGKLFKGQGVYSHDYNQYDVHYYYNVLMKIFDRQVLRTVVTEQPMYYQQVYGQYSYEKMWDLVFTHQGIFDHEYLVEIINNPELRTWFVQHGYFDKVVLDQILYAYKTEGIYDQYLLQKLVNTEVLKYFFVKQGVSVYDILGQTTYGQYHGKTFYNKGYFLGQTPKMTYKHLPGVYGYEYGYNTPSFTWNKLLGKQYYGYNQGPYSYSNLYQQYPLTQHVY